MKRLFKAYTTFCSSLITGFEEGHDKKRARMSLKISAISLLLVLSILALTASCVDVTDEDKRTVKNIIFSNSIIIELTSNREYEEEWHGHVELENGIAVAGSIKITFAEPFYADRQWPSSEIKVNELSEKGSGKSWEINQTGMKSYELKDYGNNKIYIFNFNKTEHSAKLVKQLIVLVYFNDENCVVIVPFTEGEEI